MMMMIVGCVQGVAFESVGVGVGVGVQGVGVQGLAFESA